MNINVVQNIRKSPVPVAVIKPFTATNNKVFFPSRNETVLSCHVAVMQQMRPVALVRIQSTLGGDASSTAEAAVHTPQ